MTYVETLDYSCENHLLNMGPQGRGMLIQLQVSMYLLNICILLILSFTHIIRKYFFWFGEGSYISWLILDQVFILHYLYRIVSLEYIQLLKNFYNWISDKGIKVKKCFNEYCWCYSKIQYSIQTLHRYFKIDITKNGRMGSDMLAKIP